jgi:hypothetical protein
MRGRGERCARGNDPRRDDGSWRGGRDTGHGATGDGASGNRATGNRATHWGNFANGASSGGGAGEDSCPAACATAGGAGAGLS